MASYGGLHLPCMDQQHRGEGPIHNIQMILHLAGSCHITRYPCAVDRWTCGCLDCSRPNDREGHENFLYASYRWQSNSGRKSISRGHVCYALVESYSSLGGERFPYSKSYASMVGERQALPLQQSWAARYPNAVRDPTER